MHIKGFLKKKFRILLLCCMISVSAGCDRYFEPSVTIEAGSDKTITLLTVSMHGGSDSKASIYKEIVNDFMAEYEHIRISDDSQQSSQEWKTKIAADFSVGNEPDVIQFFTDKSAGYIVSTDKFVTIEKIRSVYPEYASNIAPEYLQAAANTDGIQRAVPTVGYWEGLYCNLDLFEEYQVPLPSDWDSFLFAIETFTKWNITPISISLNHVPHYLIEFMLLNYAGPDRFDFTAKDTREHWISALQMIKTLHDMGAFPENAELILDEAAENLFKNKEAAMMINGSWFLAGIPDQEKTIIIPFPNINKNEEIKDAIIGGISTGFYITEKAWNDPDLRDAAVKFTKAHTKNESLQKYWGGVGQPVSDAIQLPEDISLLVRSGIQYSSQASCIYPSIDSQLSAEAFNLLINGLIEVVQYNKPASVLVDEVFHAETEWHSIQG